MAITRMEILNELVRQHGYRRYLEIGVQRAECFRAVRGVERRVAVDPAPLFAARPPEVLLKKTSDAFFRDNREQFDLVFVDGLHHAAQALRDLKNALACLAPRGMVVAHDCNPQLEEEQAVPRRTARWNGDVWRAFVRLRMDSPFRCFVLDTDEGVGIVDPSTPAQPLSLAVDPMDHHRVSYQDFDRDRAQWLALCSAEPLTERLARPAA